MDKMSHYPMDKMSHYFKDKMSHPYGQNVPLPLPTILGQNVPLPLFRKSLNYIKVKIFLFYPTIYCMIVEKKLKSHRYKG